jgi:hypothetical protein
VFPFYSLAICLIAAVLYVAVASALKFLIVTLAVAAIVGHSMR